MRFYCHLMIFRGDVACPVPVVEKQCSSIWPQLSHSFKFLISGHGPQCSPPLHDGPSPTPFSFRFLINQGFCIFHFWSQGKDKISKKKLHLRIEHRFLWWHSRRHLTHIPEISQFLLLPWCEQILFLAEILKSYNCTRILLIAFLLPFDDFSQRCRMSGPRGRKTMFVNMTPIKSSI